MRASGFVATLVFAGMIGGQAAATTLPRAYADSSKEAKPVPLEPDLLGPMAAPASEPGTYVPLPTGRSAEDRPDPARPEASADAPEGWTPTRHWKRNADGTVSLEQYFGPHFRPEAGGGWKPIDPALSASTEADTAFESTAALKHVRFGHKADKLIRLALDGGTVTMAAEGLAIGRPTRDGHELHYANVARDTDLVLRNTPAGVVKELRLRSAAAPRRFRFHLSDPKGLLGEAVQDAGGAVTFSNPVETETTLAIPAPYAYETAKVSNRGPAVNLDSADLTIARAGDGFDLEVSLDEGWLAGRSFPITLDPSLIYNGTAYDGTIVRDRYNCDAAGYPDGEGCSVLTTDPADGAGTVTEGTTDRRPDRTVHKFSVSTIPVGSRIDTATIKLHFGSCVGVTTWYCDNYTYHAQLGRYNGAWSSTTAYADFPAFTVTEPEVTIPPYTTLPAPITYSIKNMVQDWVEGSAVNNGFVYKLREEPATGNIGGPWLHSAEAPDATKRPYVSITYTPVPAAPASATVTKVGNTQVDASWTAPPSNGGPAVTSYTATLYRNGAAYTSYSCLCTSRSFTALPYGDYYVKVVATNSIGSGASRTSNTVVLLPAPELTKTVSPSSGRTMYARGEQLTYTLRVTNPGSTAMTVSSIVDPVPAQLDIAGGTVLDGGVACAAALCQIDGRTIRIGSFTVNPGSSRSFVYRAIAVGSQGLCVPATNAATATNSYGTDTAGLTLTVCDTGLGIENWWQFADTPIGAQHVARLNPSNGNLVVQALDSTPVQARGRLAYVVRRTYNSQDTNLVAMPGPIGAGWSLNVGHTEDLALDGVAPTGLVVPSASNGSNKLAVTLVDRDGTRHVFTLKGAGVSVDVSALAPSSTMSTLIPTVLKLPATGYNRICIDATYAPPPGVHLSLWRYVAVNTGGAAGCTPVTGSTPAVLGFTAIRPDRLRYEFSPTGHQLSAIDGSGVELRYVYESDPTPGMFHIGRLLAVYEPGSCDPPSAPTWTNRSTPPSWCRALRFQYLTGETRLTDPAGRVTRYLFDTTPTSPRLVKVVNPDGSEVSYTYQSNGYSGESCGGTGNQMCSMTDTLGTTGNYDTSFTYETAPSGPPRLKILTDRRLTASTVTYSDPGVVPNYVTVDKAGQRIRYENIDVDGRVGRLLEGDTGNVYRRQTHMRWDTVGATCRQPDNAVDNNLCTSIRRATVTTTATETTPSVAGDEETQFLYNSEGGLLRLRRINHGQAIPQLDHTYGYEVQAIHDGGGVLYADTVSGSGTVTSTGPVRSDTSTLYVLSDRTQALPPRGNVADLATHEPGRTWDDFLTTYTVANDAFVSAPNKSQAGACETRNSGVVCTVVGPSGDHAGAKPVTVSYEYDSYGQRTRTRTALMHERNQLAQTFVYRYFDQMTDRDASGSVTSHGWLRAVEDPDTKFVAYDYDRAGNVIRTWDRNATAGKTYLQFPRDPVTGILQPGHREVRFGDDATFASQPWRYARASIDPLGNRTTYTFDTEGRLRRRTPPRGNGTTTHDVTYDYDPNGNLTVETTPGNGPAETTVYTYDARNNLRFVKDPNGNYVAYLYDSADRRNATSTIRGAWPGDAEAAKRCVQTTTADTPIPAGLNKCSEIVVVNGVDNPLRIFDRDGQYTDYTYDSVHRRVRMQTPRNHGGYTTLRTEYEYDANGNTRRICPPREFDTAEPGSRSACAVVAGQSEGIYSLHNDYDALDRVVRSRTYRAAVRPLETTYTYDNAHHPVAVRDANLHTTTAEYDIQGRRTKVVAPHSASLSPTTEWRYDAVGNTTAIVAPAPQGRQRITLFGYDANNRVVDTVRAATSLDITAVGAPTADGGNNIRTRAVYDADGNVVGEYDPRAFATSVSNPDERYVTRRDVDVAGRVSAVYTPRWDNRAATSDPGLGSTTQRDQCPRGASPIAVAGVEPWPNTETDHVGVCVSRYTYDPGGRLLHVDSPRPNSRLTYGYTLDNLLRTVEGPQPGAPDSTARTTLATYEYDKSGRPVLTTDATGHQQSTAYTSDGLVKSVVASPNGTLTHTTDFDYDADGNRDLVRQPVTLEVGGAVTLERRTAYTPDRLVARVDSPGRDLVERHITTYAYDNVGNVTTIASPGANDGIEDTNPNDAPVENSYTFDNLLAATIQPVSNDGTSRLRRIEYSYDPAGRRTVTRTGNVQKVTAPDQTVTYVPLDTPSEQELEYYDSDLVKLQRGRSVDGAARPVITTTYTPAGQPATLTGAGGTTTANYYLDGTTRDVTSSGRTQTYAYDGSGARSAHADEPAGDPAGRTVSRYNYNTAGAPATMTSDAAGAGQWQWHYFADGRLATETQPNGVRREHQYFADGTLDTLAVRRDTTTLATYAYTYDEAYRQRTQTVTSPGTSAQGQARTSYDPAGRLSSYVDGTGTKNVSWDRDGNRLGYGEATYEYHADGSIRRSKDATAAPWRDSTYESFGGLAGDGCRNYEYDGFDRLVDVTAAGGTDCGTVDPVRYEYDALDRQTARVVKPDQPGQTKRQDQRYDGLGSTTVLEVGTDTVAYALGALGEPLAARKAGGTPVTHFLGGDGAGSVTLLTGTDGSLVCAARFEPYGTALSPQAGAEHSCHTGATHNSVFFKGAQRDSATGNYQLGARTYSPGRGGFLTPDSFRTAPPSAEVSLGTDPLTRNRYSYVNGDPVNLIDPTGHLPCWKFCNAVSTVVGAAVDVGQAVVETTVDVVDTVVDTTVAAVDYVVDRTREVVQDVYDEVRELKRYVAAKARAAVETTKKVVATVKKATVATAKAIGNGVATVGRAVVAGVSYCLGDGARTCAAVAGAIALAATGVGAIAGAGVLAATIGTVATYAGVAASIFSGVSFLRTGNPWDLLGAVGGVVMRPLARGVQALRAGRSVNLYRAVGIDELADIKNSGLFRAGPNSLGGKFFASTADDAARWGKKFKDITGEAFEVVATRVPKSYAKTLRYFENLDGIGPAYYADDLDELNRAVQGGIQHLPGMGG